MKRKGPNPSRVTMVSLKQRLFNEYGGFADKRIKRLERGSVFAVDDRHDGDVGADRQLLSYFCMMFADVSRPDPLTPEVLTISLSGNVPDGPGVQAWLKKHGAEYRKGPISDLLRFEVTPGHQSKLRSLAKAIRAIVAAGAPRYSVPSYKYVCPRTATSLERLADVLDSAWGASG